MPKDNLPGRPDEGPPSEFSKASDRSVDPGSSGYHLVGAASAAARGFECAGFATLRAEIRDEDYPATLNPKVHGSSPCAGHQTLFQAPLLSSTQKLRRRWKVLKNGESCAGGWQ